MAGCERSYLGNVIIHTGNVLNINEVKKKAGQNTTEELVESLKYVIKTCADAVDGESMEDIEANKEADYQNLRLDSQEERKDVKVSMKIFVRQYEPGVIRAAITTGFHSLNTPVIESVVLALEGDKQFPLQTIQGAWAVLEEFVLKKKVLTIGVSDMDTDEFITLYQWAKVKPGIVQINLTHCCVVPPALRSFTEEHEVQLLTHSDPVDILPDAVLENVIAEQENPLSMCMADKKFHWAIRYQIHVKCRGVLVSKGYIINLTK